MSKIRISKIKQSEVLQAKKLLKHVWLETYGDLYSKTAIKKIISEWHSVPNLKQQASEKQFYFAVAKSGRKIVGLVTARKVEKGIIFINRLYIHPKYQGCGIGTELLSNATGHFKSKRANLEVEEENKKAIGFYRKNGFKVVRKKKEEIEGQIISVILMEKPIK